MLYFIGCAFEYFKWMLYFIGCAFEYFKLMLYFIGCAFEYFKLMLYFIGCAFEYFKWENRIYLSGAESEVHDTVLPELRDTDRPHTRRGFKSIDWNVLLGRRQDSGAHKSRETCDKNM
jgi:hypothetical protein